MQYATSFNALHLILAQMGARGQDGVLPSEPEQMGEALSGFGPSARRRPLKPANRALDERFIHLSHGVPLLGQPPTELIAGAYIAPDTVRRIPVLVQGGREVIQVGAQRPTP